MRIVFTFLCILFTTSLSCAAPATQETIIITPNQVYAEVERIEADVLSIMKYRKRVSTNTVQHRSVQFKPRHVWQKTYEILVKINIYRRADHYPTIAVGTLEPVQELHPKLVFDQTQRILTELQLIKLRLNLVASSPTPAARIQHGKMPSDVYALLDKVSSDLDSLIGFDFTSSDVFAEVIRLNSDIEVILNALEISDVSFPPIKHKNSQPADAFKVAFELLDTVEKIQRYLSINVSDFSGLEKDTVDSGDVFELIELIIAELQPIKFSLSLQHVRTPNNKDYVDKTPADVEQLIGWCHNRLKQVHPFRL